MLVPRTGTIATRMPDGTRIVAGLAVAILMIADARALIRGSKAWGEHQRQEGHQEHSQHAQDGQSPFETPFRHGNLVKQGWCRGHRKLFSPLISVGCGRRGWRQSCPACGACQFGKTTWIQDNRPKTALAFS